MKLALVRARFTPYGGAERFVNAALTTLAARGLDVTVLSRRWSTGSEDASPFHFERCDPAYFGSTWRDISFARAVQNIIRSKRFNLVQSHERIPGVTLYRAGDGVHAAWLARRARLEGTATQLGVYLNPHHAWLVHAERAMFEHPELRLVICNSRMVQEEILVRFAIAPSKLRLVRNGVDLSHFAPTGGAQAGAMREQLGVPRDAAVLLFMGSGFARKGLRTALLAVSEGGRAGHLVHLIVAGADKHAARYAALARQLGISERCHFVGPVGQPERYYQCADALVLPTLYDPFPNAALEALASGLPVFTSDASGVKEIIVEDESGWIAPAGDASRLAAQICNWHARIADPAQRARLEEAARAAALPFGQARMREALVSIYDELLVQ